MRKLKYLLIALVFILAACGSDAPEASLTGEPIDVNKEEIYYDPIDLKLIKFNPNGNSTTIINDDTNSFAYDINNAENYFILGDSLNHKYQLVQIEEGEIKAVYNFPDGEEAYPIGYSADNIYFIHSFYEGNTENKEKRTIGVYNLTNETVTEIESVRGLLSDGIVSPNNIYYTIFNKELNYHELYKKSIEVGKKSEPPELISVGYESQDLYLSKDLFDEKEIISLYASDKNRIYSKDDSWPKFEANYFKPTTVLGIDKMDDGTMKVTFIDKRTREQTNEVANVYGIRFEGDTIVIATDLGASKY